MMGLFRGQEDCGFHPMDDYKKIGTVLWPIIEGIIKTNIENRHDIILEGVQLLPGLVAELPDSYKRQIIALFLILNKDYVYTNFKSKILKNRNIIEFRGDIDELTIKGLINHSQHLKQECMNTNSCCYEISGDYQSRLNKVEQEIIQNMLKICHIDK